MDFFAAAGVGEILVDGIDDDRSDVRAGAYPSAFGGLLEIEHFDVPISPQVALLPIFFEVDPVDLVLLLIESLQNGLLSADVQRCDCLQFVIAVLDDGQVDGLAGLLIREQAVDKPVDCLALATGFLGVVFLVFEKVEIGSRVLRVHSCASNQEVFGLEGSNEGILDKGRITWQPSASGKL